MYENVLASEESVPVRPHHGMCLAYFKGRGYSDGFSRHMQEMLDLFEKNVKICLVKDTDEICSACPNNQSGNCSSAGQVSDYDQAVLLECGLEEGAEMPFLEFAKKVQEAIILTDKRTGICGSCQWNFICADQKSRWGKLLRK